MVSNESCEGPTPNGGIRSTIYYFDADRNPADKKQATHCEIVEYAADGKELRRTYGICNGGNSGRSLKSSSNHNPADKAVRDAIHKHVASTGADRKTLARLKKRLNAAEGATLLGIGQIFNVPRAALNVARVSAAKVPAPNKRNLTTTLFSWGYYGWGNATRELVQAVDAVEQERGFLPPVFVDVRIRRTVRALGFQGPAFEKLLSAGRHIWMQGLGNEAIRTGEGGLRISRPSDAAKLLDLSLENASRRVIFFCSCQWPCICHRRAVADLLLNAAKKRDKEIEVIEWPGGEAGEAMRSVTPEILTALRRGRASVPLGNSLPAAALCGLPWGSIVCLQCKNDAARVVSGPARYHAGEWQLPVMDLVEGADDAATLQRAVAFREEFGLAGQVSLE
jgi:hypothetical protein